MDKDFGGSVDSAAIHGGAAASQRELTMRLAETKESHKERVVRCREKVAYSPNSQQLKKSASPESFERT